MEIFKLKKQTPHYPVEAVGAEHSYPNGCFKKHIKIYCCVYNFTSFHSLSIRHLSDAVQYMTTNCQEHWLLGAEPFCPPPSILGGGGIRLPDVLKAWSQSAE